LVVKGILTFPNPGLLSTGVDVGALGVIVSSGDVRLRDKEFSPEADDAKDDGLPDGVPHNVLNHLARDEVIVLVLRFTLE